MAFGQESLALLLGIFVFGESDFEPSSFGSRITCKVRLCFETITKRRLDTSLSL